MANCTYCGRPAGLLRTRHKECEETYNQGWRQMVASAFAAVRGQVPLADLEADLVTMAGGSFMVESKVREAIIAGWEQAVDHFLDDGLLDAAEEARLNSYAAHFKLSPTQLDRHGAHARLAKGLVLRQIMAGTFAGGSQDWADLPFNFQKTEKLIWAFPDTKYYEDRQRRRQELSDSPR